MQAGVCLGADAEVAERSGIQIVEATEGSRSWRGGRADTGELLSCSFCGKDQKQVKKLIAGPNVFICDGCIGRVQTVMAATSKTASTPIATIQQVARDETDQLLRLQAFRAAHPGVIIGDGGVRELERAVCRLFEEYSSLCG